MLLTTRHCVLYLVCKTLVKYGAKRIDSDDYTDEEATSNRFDCLNATEELSGWTPLHLAAIGGHLDVVYLLMEAGCDARVQDKVQ